MGVAAAVPDRKDNNSQNNDQEIVHKGNWRDYTRNPNRANCFVSSLVARSDRGCRGRSATLTAPAPERRGRKPSKRNGRDESASRARKRRQTPQSSEFRVLDSQRFPLAVQT